MNFRENIASIPLHLFIDNCELVLDLISMQDATDICHYLKPIGESIGGAPEISSEKNFEEPKNKLFTLFRTFTLFKTPFPTSKACRPTFPQCRPILRY